MSERQTTPNPMERTVWDFTLFGAWVLKERHLFGCSCSYCREFKGTCGLALPECKESNSWRVLWWRRGERLNVLRWTMPTFYRRTIGK